MTLTIPAPHRAPTTKRAILINGEGRPTWHEFHHSEERQILRGDSEIGVVFIFRCTKTGELRRWGCEYTDTELRRLRVVK